MPVGFGAANGGGVVGSEDEDEGVEVAREGGGVAAGRRGEFDGSDGDGTAGRADVRVVKSSKVRRSWRWPW